LMSGYLTDGATKSLVATGALTKLAPQRLDATARFVYDVAMSDMGRFSTGFESSVKVRIMHAMVRRSLLESPRWQHAAWGIPINQRDLLVTHLQFTVTYLGATLALGRLDTRQERDALLHLWRYVSYLLGVRDDLLPKGVREGIEQLAIFNVTEDGPDADGRALAQALISAWLNGPPAQGPLGDKIGQFLIGYARYFVGETAADALGIPDTHWKLVAPVLAIAFLPAELVQLVSPRVRALAVAWGRKRLERAFQGQSPYRAPARQPYAVQASP
jgi:ER-bound oxygenase mpaB/B'/Rubber oxygenase, catalytic domain